jgi:alpha 1,3-glucosidase
VDVLQEGDGIVRVRMDEVGSQTKWRRYNETAKWALLDANPPLAQSASLTTKKGVSTIKYGPKGSKLTLEVQHQPLRITQLRDGVAEVVLNDRSLLHMEHFRTKPVDGQEGIAEGAGQMSEGEQVVLQANDQIQRGWFEETDKDSWEEQFRQWKDSKPKGASSNHRVLLPFDVSTPRRGDQNP